MAITGEIDLTQGLDFFRHKELPSIIPRVLPWVKEKTSISSMIPHTGYLQPVNNDQELSLSLSSNLMLLASVAELFKILSQSFSAKA